MLIRPFAPHDVPAALALNNVSVPHVNELDEAEVRRLSGIAEVALVAEVDSEFAGFCWCIGPEQPYASLNYRWFSERYTDFSYLDRIAVHEQHRRLGIGMAFYTELRRTLLGRRPVLLCEVNIRPLNERSLQFHHRVGFREVGQQDTDGGAKTVSLLAWTLEEEPAQAGC